MPSDFWMATAIWPATAERRFSSSSENGEAANRTTSSTPRDSPPARTGTASSLKPSRSVPWSGAGPRSDQPSQRGVDGQVGRTLPRRRFQPQAIALALHGVEGHAVVAEVGARAVDGQHDQLGPAAHRRHVPDQGGHALQPAGVPPLRVEDAAAAQERSRRSGEDAEELRVGLGEAAGLVDGHDEPEHFALRDHGHEERSTPPPPPARPP